jgi:1-acyl-sn-glycerol-3-phosphate acyltransferase
MDVVFSTALLVICGAAFALEMTARRIRFWKHQGIRVLEPGYVPPLPRYTARLMRTILGNIFVFLFIGKLRLIGKRNLRYCGRLIVAGNHQTERDAVLIPSIMKQRHVRFFIAKNQALGFRAPLVAWLGGIVVEHATKRGPIAALSAAIKSMIAEAVTDFVIFPQGKLVRDNVLKREDFYPGVAALGRRVNPESEKKVGYLPIGIYYDRDPKNATLLHKLLRGLGIKGFRRFFGETISGAVVVIGEPIPVDCLPDDPVKATDELFERICTLSARAEQIGKGL